MVHPNHQNFKNHWKFIETNSWALKEFNGDGPTVSNHWKTIKVNERRGCSPCWYWFGKSMMSCSVSWMSPCWGSHWASKSMLGLRGPPTVNTHVMEVLNMESLVASEAPSSYVNLAHKTIDQISPWWWLWGQRWRPHFCPTQQHLVFSPILTLTPISLLSFSTNGKNENLVLVMSEMILSRLQYLIT